MEGGDGHGHWAVACWDGFNSLFLQLYHPTSILSYYVCISKVTESTKGSAYGFYITYYYYYSD